MAVVLSSEENNYFSSGGLKRSHSGKFATASPRRQFTSSPSLPSLGSPISYDSASPRTTSSRSSSTSSPKTLRADANSPLFQSTTGSSISLDNLCNDIEEAEDQIAFPSYDDVGYFDQTEDLEAPSSPRGTGESYTVSPSSNTASTSTDASRPESPDIVVDHAEDDTAIRAQPTRHVDYLSHNWREEDIWSSWQFIVSRRGTYSNSARLENASWRTWIKNKYKLKTVSPETLNWLKDCDVTWLYGPLQTGSDNPLSVPSSSTAGSSRLSKSNSFLHKKPILKKRSMSEVMLQRSLSASSLLKQAAAAVQAQQAGQDRPGMGRATSDYVAFPFSSRYISNNTSVLQSVSSSGFHSPSYEKKHIHFNEQVEQCIALEIKGEDDDDYVEYAVGSDSDSDDGVMMKRSMSKRKLPPLGSKRGTPRNNSFSGEPKTIASLPSTTLKYREDTPEPQETAMKHSSGLSKLSPSPSQETLRPSKPSSSGFLLGDDDDSDDDINWMPNTSFANRRDSISVTQDRLGGLSLAGSSADDASPSGMRRTSSGMFMPADDDEDQAVSEGLFGKVVDTVNTAKDIAHVIWNVGWRR